MEQHNQKKRKGFFRRLFWFLNILFIALLLASYLAPYINPNKVYIFQFLGLAYPILLLINLFFIAIWILRRKWKLLYSLIAILIGWNQLGTFYQYNKSKKVSLADNNLIKIVSYNVRNFDLYNYTKDWKHNYENRNKIFELVDKENPDIICYQEFVNDKSGKFKTLDTLIELQKATNYHDFYTSDSRNINYFGIATFSAYPIVNKGIVDFGNSKNNTCIYSDIKIKEDTIRVYNLHFESIHLSRADVKFANDIGNIKNLKDNKKFTEDSRRILGRLKLAFIKRAHQAKLVADHASKSPYPAIVCGDFNDTPSSYVYRLMTEHLNDAFVNSGKGFGKTYTGIFPSFRIDYILYSNEFEPINFQVIPVDFSDHHPIRCFMKLNK